MYNFKYNDGGKPVTLRERVGADCAPRALAIATGIPYRSALTLCKAEGFKAGEGIDDEDFARILKRFGFVFEPARPGARLADVTGCAIADIGEHVVAVVDGVVNDTFDTLKLEQAERLLGVWRRRSQCATR